MKLPSKVFGVLLVFVFLLVIVSANPFATVTTNKVLSISTNGLSDKALGIANCAANPANCVAGRIQGEVIGEMAAQLPGEIGQAYNTYNQINGELKDGVQITKELGIGKNGAIESGSMEFKNQESSDLSSFFNKGESDKKIEVSGKGISIDKKDGVSKITFDTGGSLEVNGNKFEKVTKGSTIELDENGEIKSADLTARDATTFNLDGKNISVQGGSNVRVENGEIIVNSKGAFQLTSGKYSASISPGGEIKIRNDGSGEIISGKGMVRGNLVEFDGDISLSKDKITLIGEKSKLKLPGGNWVFGKDSVNTDVPLFIQGRSFGEKSLSQFTSSSGNAYSFLYSPKNKAVDMYSVFNEIKSEQGVVNRVNALHGKTLAYAKNPVGISADGSPDGLLFAFNSPGKDAFIASGFKGETSNGIQWAWGIGKFKYLSPTGDFSPMAREIQHIERNLYGVGLTGTF